MTATATERAAGARAVQLQVALAALPLLLVRCLWVESDTAAVVAATLLGALLGDSACDRLRGRAPWHSAADGSALVIALLLGLSLPAGAPLWLALLSGAIATALGKQLYGGLGDNPFNPAMLAYALALLAWPAAMSQWPPALAVDALSGATALDLARVASRGDALPPDWRALGPAHWAGAAAALAGAWWLRRRRLITWREPLATVAAMALLAAALHALDPSRFADPALHVLAGAGLFGAFFIATEPVCAPAHPRARLGYCAAIGALAVLIRAFGHYPDGFAFAVLLMNAAAPALDRHWRGPR